MEILLFVFLGVLLGIATGLVPGVHPNMMVLLVPFIASLGVNPLHTIVFIVALGVSNTIADFLPSIFLGAPESDSSLSVLPGHRMLLQGHGYDAVKLTVTGALLSTCLLLPMMPLIIYFIPEAIELVSPQTHFIIAAIAAYLVLTEKNRIAAAFVFLGSGTIGILLLSLPVNSTLMLFPMMSGFFGVSTLLLSRNAAVPEQKSETAVSLLSVREGILNGLAGGLASGFLPGVGAGGIAALASIRKGDHAFLATMGAITTVNTITSVMALAAIGKTRSGIAVAISQLSPGTGWVAPAIFASVIAVALSSLVTLKLARMFAKISKNYSRIRLLVIVLIISMTVLFTGVPGVIALFACSSMGVFAASRVKRSLMMGSLMVPVVLFYA